MIIADLPLVAALIRNSRKTTINRAMLGHSISRTIGPVTKEDILSYVEATLDNPSRYGKPGTGVPPFYYSRLLYPMFRYFMINRELGLNLLRMVHGQQTAEWHGSIREGDMVDVRMTIRDIYSSSAGETIIFHITLS